MNRTRTPADHVPSSPSSSRATLAALALALGLALLPTAARAGEPVAPAPTGDPYEEKDAAAPSPPPPTAPAAPAPAPVAAPAPASEADTTEASSSGGAGRLVVEIAALGGYTFGKVTRADLRSLDGTAYTFASNSGGQFLAVCGSVDAIEGSGDCRAITDAGSSGTVGGELLVGYAATDEVTVGGRLLAGANLPSGVLLAGGPALSVRVGPVWLGGGVAIGTLNYRADVTGAVGSVPPDFQDANGGDEVEIAPSTVPIVRDTVKTKLILGATLELAAAVYQAEVDEDLDALRGSLVIGIWPTVVYAFPGVGVSIPIGLGYRFH
ncbi:MAG: hypothetical protein HY908_21220 [Myxococcales bacterium]|nr:hypothetical protein [Myxococcales bacterium]